MKSLTTRLAVGVVAGVFVSTLASAETIRQVRAGDSLTMDPMLRMKAQPMHWHTRFMTHPA